MVKKGRNEAAESRKLPRDQYTEALAQLKRLGAKNQKTASPAITSTDLTEKKRRPSASPSSETDNTALLEDEDEQRVFSRGDVLDLQLSNAFGKYRHNILMWVIGIVLGLLGVFYGVIVFQIGDAKADLRESIRDLRVDVKEELKAVQQRQDITEAKIQQSLLPRPVGASIRNQNSLTTRSREIEGAA